MNATVKRIFDRGLGDAKVRSVMWSDEDLLVDLIMPGSPVPGLRLRFVLVARLQICFDFGDYCGHPLLFSASVEEIENERWKVTFEFGAAPEGTMSLECDEILNESS